ncbi:MAG: hypothetical protein COA47_02555 [Robiginitomaculum sp.]|nr:MAG: hypothetical protein COA47_02555 [Robiginitomaculum sp.]
MTKLSFVPVAGALFVLLPAAPGFSQSSSTQAINTDDEIIVTTSPLGQVADESLVGTSIVGKEELKLRMAGSVGELLKFEPGISSTFFGPGASRPIIRGQGGDRIRVLDNGIGSIDASSASPDHGVAIEPAMAERVEIVRGSGLLRFGSSGAGGVVNVIDGRIPDAVPVQPITGVIRVGAATVDSSREIAGGFNFAPRSNAQLIPVFHVEAAKRTSNDYSVPGFTEVAALRALPGNHPAGVVVNSAAESLSLAAGFSLIGAQGYVGIAVKSLDSKYGIPGGDELPTIELKQFRYDANGSYQFDGGFLDRVDFFGGIADYKHAEIEETGAVGTIFRNQGWETRVEFVQAKIGKYQAAYGLQLQSRDFSAIGEEAFVPPTRTRQTGFFTFQQFNAGGWHMEGALRYETTRHTSLLSGAERSFEGLSLSSGLDHHINSRLKLGGTVFRTVRSPNSNELFSNGPHLATAQFELGDIDLQQEIATGAELVARYKNGDFSMDLNLFYTRYQNYVFGEETGAVRDGLAVFQFRGANARFQGVEVQISKGLGQWKGWDMLLTGQLDLVNANLTDGVDEPLPRIPPMHGLLGVEADNGIWSLRTELFMAATQNALARNETRTAGYVMANAFVAVRPFRSNDAIQFRASVSNIFDATARQHTSFLKDVVPLPGRNVRVSLDVEF